MERRDFLLHTINKSHWKGNTARQAVFALTMTRRGAGWKYIPKYADVYSCTLKISIWIDDLALMGCFSALCPGPGGVQGQPGLVGGDPAHGRGWDWVGSEVPSNPTHALIL